MEKLPEKPGLPGTYTGWFVETGGSRASWRSAQPYRLQRVYFDPLLDGMTVLLARKGFGRLGMLLRGDSWAEAITRTDEELKEPIESALSKERERTRLGE